MNEFRWPASVNKSGRDFVRFEWNSLSGERGRLLDRCRICIRLVHPDQQAGSKME
jgi:hypothetical protein